MTDQVKEHKQESSSEQSEPPSPDDLVHMYGSFLMVAVPVILILLILWLVFR